MNRCTTCGGTIFLDQQITDYQPWGDRIFILENVPARVCRQCGEWIVSGSVAKKIEQVVRSGATPTRMEQVPVYDLANVEPADVQADVEEVPA